ncbi:hypothetical protein Tco_1562936 [Tanacetum coccineum]
MRPHAARPRERPHRAPRRAQLRRDRIVTRSEGRATLVPPARDPAEEPPPLPDLSDRGPPKREGTPPAKERREDYGRRDNANRGSTRESRNNRFDRRLRMEEREGTDSPSQHYHPGTPTALPLIPYIDEIREIDEDRGPPPRREDPDGERRRKRRGEACRDRDERERPAPRPGEEERREREEEERGDEEGEMQEITRERARREMLGGEKEGWEEWIEREEDAWRVRDGDGRGCGRQERERRLMREGERGVWRGESRRERVQGGDEEREVGEGRMKVRCRDETGRG